MLGVGHISMHNHQCEKGGGKGSIKEKIEKKEKESIKKIISQHKTLHGYILVGSKIKSIPLTRIILYPGLSR